MTSATSTGRPGDHDQDHDQARDQDHDQARDQDHDQAHDQDRDQGPGNHHDHDLIRRHTIYSCVMGSRAFGLATGTSDTDVRGVFVAPTPLFWGFTKPPTHVDGPAPEQFSWEIERFCELALRANPNVLECLNSPIVLHADATGRELLDLREAFMSRQVHATFARYARAQQRKLEADVRAHGAPRWKHAMHLLRLLTSCRDLLRTGKLVVDVGPEREFLLRVRNGEVPWDDVARRMDRLTAEADAAVGASPLPAEPDRARVEDFLIRTRRAGAEAWPAAFTGPYDEIVQGIEGLRGDGPG